MSFWARMPASGATAFTAPVILLGIGILTTAQGLLTQAERVQAEQVAGSAAPGEPAGAEVPAEDLWRELAKDG